MEEKRKRLFNGFDLAVLIIAIVAAVVCYFVVFWSPAVETVLGDTAVYYVEYINLTELQAAQPSVGDELQEGSKFDDMGTIIDIEIEPYQVRVQDEETKTFRFEEVPNRVTMRLKIETPIQETEQEILAGGEQKIKGGLSVNLTGPGYNLSSGTILTIERGVE